MPRQKAVAAAVPLTAVTIGPVASEDLAQVTRLDADITGKAKPDYWRGLFEGAKADPKAQVFLVARQGAKLKGFILTK